jgi:hypothetical protein
MKPRAGQVSVDPSGLVVVTTTNVQAALAELDAAVGSGSYSDEQARDAIGAALVEGAGIDITVDDTANTITVASTITQYTDENARDAIGAALVAGTDIDITVDDTANTITVSSTATGGGSSETYEDVVTALTGKVHRWMFDEASGATVADSISSLNLTLSGTYTRAVAGLFGSASATTFGASAKAVSSGLGSLPVGGNARCFIVLYKSTGAGAKQALISYGPTGSTRQWFTGVINDGQSNRLGTAVWADDLALDYVYTEGGWHLAAFGYDAMQNTLAYQDGYLGARRPSAAINTGSSGNFQIGLSTNSDGQFAGSIEDVLVLDNWPEKRVLDRLYRTISAL